MNRFLSSLGPEDILALIVILGCFWLKTRGTDGATDNIITAVVSYRLGHQASTNAGKKRAQERQERRDRQESERI